VVSNLTEPQAHKIFLLSSDMLYHRSHSSTFSWSVTQFPCAGKHSVYCKTGEQADSLLCFYVLAQETKKGIVLPRHFRNWQYCNKWPQLIFVVLPFPLTCFPFIHFSLFSHRSTWPMLRSLQVFLSTLYLQWRFILPLL